VIDRLADFVDHKTRVYEFGGGGSTAWFGDRAGSVVTIEHDSSWYTEIIQAVRDLPHVTVRLVSAAHFDSCYSTSIDVEPEDSLDLVLVDGRCRVACVVHAMSKVRTGGLIVLDDSDRTEYRAIYDLLRHWRQETYFGLVPCKDEPSHTTIWRRPPDYSTSAAPFIRRLDAPDRSPAGC
jgi:predicted O-methyltransferase YrrM